MGFIVCEVLQDGSQCIYQDAIFFHCKFRSLFTQLQISASFCCHFFNTQNEICFLRNIVQCLIMIYYYVNKQNISVILSVHREMFLENKFAFQRVKLNNLISAILQSTDSACFYEHIVTWCAKNVTHYIVQILVYNSINFFWSCSVIIPGILNSFCSVVIRDKMTMAYL